MGYRVLALISGGKDSCFAMMSSVAAGHEIVALANLRPKDLTASELDSYMFQTVGHEAIELYAEAMRLPLFRGDLKRASVCLGADYTPNDEDEVEDLHDLIVTARDKVPFDAVCSGAILSDYQRVRVESVCSRLGLVSLSYLWRRDQSELLQEMIDCGVEAAIIKCAALGLEEWHLGKTLAELQPRLEDLKSRYGINVCGEGGEYESFTLDCPLFYKSIQLDDTEVILHSDDAFAPVKLLRLNGISLRDKELPQFSNQAEMLSCVKMRTPLDFLNGEVLASGNRAPLPSSSSPETTRDQVSAKTSLPRRQQAAAPPSVRVVGAINGRWFSFSGFGSGGINSEASQATRAAFKELGDRLGKEGLALEDVASITVALRDMSDYAAVNDEYVKTFSSPNPPSRACVESRDAPSLVTLSGVGFKVGLDGYEEDARLIEDRGGGRSTMHVQSISHWAPANIGPYSQAVKVDGIVHLAGQIGLVPGTMQLVEGGAEAEARLALRHAFRALEAVGTSAKRMVQAICFVTDGSHVAAASLAWREALQHAFSSGDDASDEEHLKFSWVEVSGLPRGALVEWHIVAGLPETADSDTADSETADGESGVKRAGGVGEDNPWDMDDVISELRYDKSFGLLLGSRPGRRPRFFQRRRAGDLEFFVASFTAAPAVEGDQSPDLVFPEALTLMSAQTFATPAYAGNVPSSLRSTLFPGGCRFGVEGRREHEEDQILVIGCVRRHKVGR